MSFLDIPRTYYGLLERRLLEEGGISQRLLDCGLHEVASGQRHSAEHQAARLRIAKTLVSMCNASKGLLALARASAEVTLEQAPRAVNGLADALANDAYDHAPSSARSATGVA